MRRLIVCIHFRMCPNVALIVIVINFFLFICFPFVIYRTCFLSICFHFIIFQLPLTSVGTDSQIAHALNASNLVFRLLCLSYHVRIPLPAPLPSSVLVVAKAFIPMCLFSSRHLHTRCAWNLRWGYWNTSSRIIRKSLFVSYCGLVSLNLSLTTSLVIELFSWISCLGTRCLSHCNILSTYHQLYKWYLVYNIFKSILNRFNKRISQGSRLVWGHISCPLCRDTSSRICLSPLFETIHHILDAAFPLWGSI